MKTLNLIGAGKLGQTLARLWQQQGIFQVQQVLTRSNTSAQHACAFINEQAEDANRPSNPNRVTPAQAVTSYSELRTADIWLLATPDGEIAEVATELHRHNGLISEHSVLFHCSGTLNSDLLVEGQNSHSSTSKANVASVHPIHSFASPAESLTNFAGSYCGYEGGAAALNVLLPAFTAIGAQLFKLDGEQKTLYHAASVMACNYLVGLMDASLECFDAAGVDRTQAQQLLLPITQQTLSNVLNGSPQSALTGPISRGDLATVEDHLDKLEPLSKPLTDIYRALGRQTVKVAEQQDPAADTQSLELIKSLLNSTKNPL
ncbi:Rossmann-like and DUF2520 domain-containing protein [Pseudomaricurvus sp.]|uniref:Rossmann-like and DUF2520 domain-containing protein n=1 Tax=Pseudomaricurvus sp. TaxID=2004510 RepID=UPI003F6C8674